MQKIIVLSLLTISLSITVNNIYAAEVDTAAGKKLFKNRCTACHSIGDGKVVGPDLMGVNKRREKSWLLKFIHNPQKMINNGNETAVELYNEYNQTQMTAQQDLDEGQIGSILAYIKKQTRLANKEKEKNKAQASGKVTEVTEGKSIIPSYTKKIIDKLNITKVVLWLGGILIIISTFLIGYIISSISSK